MRLKRVFSGLFLGAVFVSAILWLPHGAALPALVLIYLAAALEFGALLDAARLPHFRLLNFCGGLILLGVTWFAPDGQTGNALVLLVLLSAFFAICLRQFLQLADVQPIHTMAPPC